MAVQGLLLYQVSPPPSQIWSHRWDLGRAKPGWQQDLVTCTEPRWPEQWKNDEYYLATHSTAHFVVYTCVDDVLIFALGDEELGELGLQTYLEIVVSLLSKMRKEGSRLSVRIREELSEYALVLSETVAPGGKVAYTVPPDE
eukprot:TRINITY_DN3264_c0_g1_i2.p1 TRINITY_DN3264_c0_g1~~TRINITY_DN3264_c0_g1_i2.p1  ORF type:complete len:142 (+),score=41.53 TRINITY_DN3264_c0_g1_i2:65-490(+)